MRHFLIPEKATTITVQTVTKQDVTESIPPNPVAPQGVYAVTDADGRQYYTSFEEKEWRCPSCGKLDDGTPMIGCDGDCEGRFFFYMKHRGPRSNKKYRFKFIIN